MPQADPGFLSSPGGALTAQSRGWAPLALAVFKDVWQEQQARAQASSAARDTAARGADRVVAFDAGVWERTGAGPTPTELGDELGWSPALRASIIRLPAKEEVLTYSTKPRALAGQRSVES